MAGSKKPDDKATADKPTPVPDNSTVTPADAAAVAAADAAAAKKHDPTADVTPVHVVADQLTQDAPTSDQLRAANKRHAAAVAADGSAPPQNDIVDALLHERRGYVQRGGMDERIKQVDEQLRHYGAKPPKD